MFINILDYVLYFFSGIFFDMSLVHLLKFEETKHHPMIARSKYPRLASTLWGLFQLFTALLILLLLHYRFELRLSTLFIFLGFSFWAIFLGVIAERRARKAAH